MPVEVFSKLSRSGNFFGFLVVLVIFVPIGNENRVILQANQELTRSGISNMTPIKTSIDLGTLVRKRRKASGLTLKEAAALADVGIRFLSELERGKSTSQLGLTLRILQLFGLDLFVQAR